ncbi:MAG: C13 family peptidase [Alphaproteobacteria bacterium]
MMCRAFLALALFATLAASARAQDPALSQGGPIVWKALLVAGDDSIPAFDNAVRTLGGKLHWRGIAALRALTARRAVRAAESIATAENVAKALADLKVGAGEGCLVFMTSHGTEQGLVFERDRANNRNLYPEDLGRALDAHCGQAPTVVVMSGCHTGTFLREATQRPNRIILTAARREKVSFGCDFRREYTYFDGCFLGEFDRAADWRELFDKTVLCIERLESASGVERSEPQAYFGDAIAGIKLPGIR